MSMPPDLSTLRHILARLEQGGTSRPAERFGFGFDAIDIPLEGGLARGALHEILARSEADGVAATGFALGLAMRAASGRPIVAVRPDFLNGEAGWLHGQGLAAFGADAPSLVMVRARNATDVLRAAAEAVRCPALGTVMAEIWGAPAVLDLKATRHLALQARESGVTLLLVRTGAEPAASAAVTRWQVQAALSAALEANAPGSPAFQVTLLRHRAGVSMRTWHVEWNRDRKIFREPAFREPAVREPALRDLAPLSRPLVSPSRHRPPAAQDEAAGIRKTG